MTNAASAQSQPACLKILFLTEMWERFGFYIVQVLLIFYLTKVFHLSDLISGSILGAFTAISYATPIAGGFLADRFLGFKHSVILGGILLSTGYAMLSIQDNALFYIALGTISVGTGFFKPNISSYLGNFYTENDPRCENGYTIFYIGINIGIVLCTLTSGYILSLLGWRAAFLSASVALLIGITTFIGGLYTLKKNGKLNPLKKISIPRLSLFNTSLIYASVIGAILLASVIIKNVGLANYVFTFGGIGLLFMLARISLRADPAHSGKMLATLMLITSSVLFWSLYFQLFISLNLFVDRLLDRSTFGFTLPSPLFISLMPLFMMVFGPSIGRMWQSLEAKNKNPSFCVKFALSLFAMGVGLALLVLGTYFTNMSGLVSKGWVVSAYILFSFAELLISPICIAMVINYVPTKYTGIMMGAYLAAIGFGAKLASVISNYAAIPDTLQTLDSMASIYHHAFIIDTGIAVCAGALILSLRKVIQKLTSQQYQLNTVVNTYAEEAGK